MVGPTSPRPKRKYLNHVCTSYNLMEYGIWNTSLQRLRQSKNQSLNPQITSHISPLRAPYRMYIERILKKILTAPKCIAFDGLMVQQLPGFSEVQFLYHSPPKKICYAMYCKLFLNKICGHLSALHVITYSSHTTLHNLHTTIWAFNK